MKREVAFKIQREAMGLTQKDIAEFAGVSSATVSNYENGADVKEELLKIYEDDYNTLWNEICELY